MLEMQISMESATMLMIVLILQETVVELEVVRIQTILDLIHLLHLMTVLVSSVDV